MATQNLPTRSTAADIRSLFEKSRKQMEMALPKHLTADRMLRVAMTSIQRTPKLLECTPQSLLACVMTCAQLGLEPDQFLGQAYLIPYGKTCTLIPGYRGYIALARRSGEVQTLSAQVVYSNDVFELQYGTEDKLEHKPAMTGERGNPIGAYCVIKYKDGGYSFDFMSAGDIEKIRKRSKAANDGPWVTDWDEMAKKTVIRRHIKLAPLSIEVQTAAVLEDRAIAGESQMDLMGNLDDDVVDVTDEPEDRDALIVQFNSSIPSGADMELLAMFIADIAKKEKATADDVKIAATKDHVAFWKAFDQYAAKNKKEPEPEPILSKSDCPNEPGTKRTAEYCAECKGRDGCPSW